MISNILNFFVKEQNWPMCHKRKQYFQEIRVPIHQENASVSTVPTKSSPGQGSHGLSSRNFQVLSRTGDVGTLKSLYSQQEKSAACHLLLSMAHHAEFARSLRQQGGSQPYQQDPSNDKHTFIFREMLDNFSPSLWRIAA